MEPQEGRRYIELIKDEDGRGWDHAYNIFEDYIHVTVDGKLEWRSSSSVPSDSDDALENWQNRLHELSFRKCGLITQSLRCVMTELIELLIYEGILELSKFLQVFEEKVFEPQRLLKMQEALKDTPLRWWEAHKQTIHEWAQC